MQTIKNSEYTKKKGPRKLKYIREHTDHNQESGNVMCSHMYLLIVWHFVFEVSFSCCWYCCFAFLFFCIYFFTPYSLLSFLYHPLCICLAVVLSTNDNLKNGTKEFIFAKGCTSGKKKKKIAAIVASVYTYMLVNTWIIKQQQQQKKSFVFLWWKFKKHVSLHRLRYFFCCCYIWAYL